MGGGQWGSGAGWWLDCGLEGQHCHHKTEAMLAQTLERPDAQCQAQGPQGNAKSHQLQKR